MKVQKGKLAGDVVRWSLCGGFERGLEKGHWHCLYIVSARMTMQAVCPAPGSHADVMDRGALKWAWQIVLNVYCKIVLVTMIDGCEHFSYYESGSRIAAY